MAPPRPVRALGAGVLLLLAGCTASVASDAMLDDARARSDAALGVLERATAEEVCAAGLLDATVARVERAGCRPFVRHPDDRRAERLCEVATENARYQRAQIVKRCGPESVRPASVEAALAAARNRPAEALAALERRPIDCTVARAWLARPRQPPAPGANDKGRPRVPVQLPAHRWRRFLHGASARIHWDVPFRTRVQAIGTLVDALVVQTCNPAWRAREHQEAAELCERAHAAFRDAREALARQCPPTVEPAAPDEPPAHAHHCRDLAARPANPAAPRAVFITFDADRSSVLVRRALAGGAASAAPADPALSAWLQPIAPQLRRCDGQAPDRGALIDLPADGRAPLLLAGSGTGIRCVLSALAEHAPPPRSLLVRFWGRGPLPARADLRQRASSIDPPRAMPYALATDILRGAEGDVRSCRRRLPPGTPLPQWVRVRVRINPAGRVAGVEMIQPASVASELACCIGGALHPLRFPEPFGGEDVSVSHVFFYTR